MLPLRSIALAVAGGILLESDANCLGEPAED
jgi:hypothetical protein